MLIAVVDPVYVVLAPGQGGWWTDWGSTVLPISGSLIVALIALIGVMVAANQNVRSALAAETTRHANAIEHSERLAVRGEKVVALMDLIDAAYSVSAALSESFWRAGHSAKQVEVSEREFDAALRSWRSKSAVAKAYANPEVISAASEVTTRYLATRRVIEQKSATELEAAEAAMDVFDPPMLDHLVATVRADLGIDQAAPSGAVSH